MPEESHIKKEPLSLFISSAEADKTLCQELKNHLSGLQRQDMIRVWERSKITAGTDWASTIDQHLEDAAVILLLISADFLASDYLYGIELQRALERHGRDEARVIPIILKPCDWHHTLFARLEVLPHQGKPITLWHNRDTAWVNVIDGIRAALEEEQQYLRTPLAPGLPQIWSIPYPRNPVFTGREDLLAKIADILHTQQSSAFRQPLAISGLGGIGKTQVVLEYVYQHRQEYQVVLWAQADTREKLIESFTIIAGLLQLQEQHAQDQMVIVQAVKSWMQTHVGWLLILDNADELMLAHEFISPVVSGHLILTTRAQASSRLAYQVDVNILDLDAATMLLMRRSGQIPPTESMEQMEMVERSIAQKIAQELGGLPLALDQAGAYIEETACSLQDYLVLYQTQRATLLKKRGDIVVDHPEPVATTWSLSFARLEQGNPAATDLLRACAFLHPDAIPEEIFTEGAEYQDTSLRVVVHDPLAWNKTIAALRMYSLIQRDTKNRTLSVHRLVQAVLRDEMEGDSQCQWVEHIIQALNKVFPEAEFKTWPRCERYVSHVFVCAALTKQWNIQTMETAQLLNKTGNYLKERGQYAQAEHFFRDALSISLQYVPESPNAAQSLNNLALLYSLQGKYAQSEALYKQALNVWENLLGPEHIEVARVRNNLAILYHTQGKYIEAKSLYLQSLESWKNFGGTQHIEVARALNNLAAFYHDLRNYTEAEDLYKQALTIWESLLGSEHPDTLSCFNNLAGIYAEQGKYLQAEPLYQQVLDIRQKILGPSHPELATSLNNLGRLYVNQGKLQRAEPLLIQARNMQEQVFGQKHVDLALTIHNLATLYCAQQDYNKAEQYYLQALTMYKQTVGPSHFKVATTLNDLAGCYLAQKKYELAEPLYREALALYEQIFGPEHLNVATSLNNLAALYMIQNKYTEAEPLYQRALYILEKIQGPEHPAIAILLSNLAMLSHAQLNNEAAEKFYTRALTINEQKLGIKHPNTVMIIKQYASLLRDISREADAIVLEARISKSSPST